MNPPGTFACKGTEAVASRRTELSEADEGQMRALLDRYFEGVTAEQFSSDLAGKDWVLRIFSDGRLTGFSTLAVDGVVLDDGREVNVVYSGDTIMAPEAWGSPVLAREWIRLVRRVLSTLSPRTSYWLLLSSGFRTYRFLPVFWRRFWPERRGATPAAEKALLNELARNRFGQAYDEEAGVVRFDAPQRLRRELAGIPAERLKDAHVAFFLRQNPGHAAGDELVCLTELSDENLTPAGRRMVREVHA